MERVVGGIISDEKNSAFHRHPFQVGGDDLAHRSQEYQHEYPW